MKLVDPKDETIKFYKTQLSIFRKENKELKAKARKAAEFIKEEYDSRPFHNDFTFAGDSRLSLAHMILVGKKLF